jgi:hypothetical protein
VHLRRALLLFALVLGVAALAASLSRDAGPSDPAAPSDVNTTQTQRDTPTETAPTATPGDAPVATGVAPRTLRFDVAEDQTRRLETGAAASVEVIVEEPGLVSIPLLGLSGPAEPVTPARFDVLVADAGNYPVVFTPALGDEEREVGLLSVSAPKG